MIAELIPKQSSEIALTTLVNKYIGKSNFRIGLGYTKFGTFEHNHDILRDETYFNISMFNAEYRYNSETGQERILNVIPYDYCNDSFSNLIEDEVIERFQLQTHICPSTDDYYLIGDLNSRVYRDIEIFITPCNNDTSQDITWKPQEEIDDVINSGFINAPIAVSYFDFDNYESPVKTILSEPDDHYLLPNATTWVECFIRENTALTSDNIFYSEPFTETKFYDVGTQNIKTINQVVSDGAILFITIGNYAQTIQFERTVYSMLDLFGYLGGLYDFMFLVGLWLINGFQNKIYHNLISSSIYQVKSTARANEFELDANRAPLEETKSYLQNNTTTLYTHSSSFRRSSRNWIVPSLNKRIAQINRANTIANNLQTPYHRLSEFQAELNTRRMYTFKLHNICCPIFK